MTLEGSMIVVFASRCAEEGLVKSSPGLQFFSLARKRDVEMLNKVGKSRSV